MLRRNETPAWSFWEYDVARAVSGKVTPGSGNGTMQKGDVKNDILLIDCKYTDQKAYRFTERMWDKLNMWARNEGRIPCLAVRFGKYRSVKSESGCVEFALLDSIDLMVDYMPEVSKGRQSGLESAYVRFDMEGEVVGFQIGCHNVILFDFCMLDDYLRRSGR